MEPRDNNALCLSKATVSIECILRMVKDICVEPDGGSAQRCVSRSWNATDEEISRLIIAENGWPRDDRRRCHGATHPTWLRSGSIDGLLFNHRSYCVLIKTDYVFIELNDSKNSSNRSNTLLVLRTNIHDPPNRHTHQTTTNFKQL